MKIVLRVIGVLLVTLLLAGAGVYVWASTTSTRLRSRTFEAHTVDFPMSFPLSEEELAESGLNAEEGEQLAMERALQRGKHLVEVRYACTECHGQDFGGGVMIDAPLLGRILGPNLTSGTGSRTVGYRPADWDRIVRHGLLRDGRPGAMPSEDFQLMSDQELSDIVVYLLSQPPVDNEVPPPTLGPLGKVLMATGQLRLSADLIESHDAPHAVNPPPAEVSVEFGEHLAGICTGCHRENLAGGPIAAGDPSWAPARNLTPHSDGLAGWTYEQFIAAMRDGIRPDGTELLMPMSLMLPYAQDDRRGDGGAMDLSPVGAGGREPGLALGVHCAARRVSVTPAGRTRSIRLEARNDQAIRLVLRIVLGAELSRIPDFRRKVLDRRYV